VSAQQVSVDVYDGELMLQTGLIKLVRVTPAGYSAVVYGNSVYELRPDRSIDIQSESFEIADCRRFLLDGKELIFRNDFEAKSLSFMPFSNRWALEERSSFYYFLFDAHRVVAKKLLDYLHISGFTVQRWDASTKLSDEGEFFNWFAHIQSDLPFEELYSSLAAFLATAPPQDLEELLDTQPQTQSVTIDEESNRKIAALEAKIEKLEITIKSLTDSNQSLQIEISKMQGMHSEIEKLLNSKNLSIGEKLEKELKQTAEFIEYADFEINNLKNELANKDTQLQALQNDFDRQFQDNENLNVQLLSFLEEKNNSKSLKPNSAPKQGVENFLDNAFSRIKFLANSAEILASFTNPKAAIRTLFLLDQGNAIGKDIQGLPGWREISQIQTGIKGWDERGRIYYRAKDNVVFVSIHLKESDNEQERHFNALKRLDI
jgi:chaperonin cofactor prefoldin